MRDMATLEQLVVLSNMESINAVLIHQGLAAPERLAQLNGIAITQMRSLVGMGVVWMSQELECALDSSRFTREIGIR